MFCERGECPTVCEVEWVKVVFRGESERYGEPLEYFGPPTVPFFFLIQKANEEAAEDADEGSEHGNLSRQRGERCDEGHHERPDERGSEEPEGQ